MGSRHLGIQFKIERMFQNALWKIKPLSSGGTARALVHVRVGSVTGVECHERGGAVSGLLEGDHLPGVHRLTPRAAGALLLDGVALVLSLGVDDAGRAPQLPDVGVLPAHLRAHRRLHRGVALLALVDGREAVRTLDPDLLGPRAVNKAVLGELVVLPPAPASTKAERAPNQSLGIGFF